MDKLASASPSDDSTSNTHRRGDQGCVHKLVANYREAYEMHAGTGILFNHESPRQPERFVAQKIASTAARIAAGSDAALCVGETDIQRDRGWASEYVEGMWSLPQAEQPRRFVIATGAADPGNAKKLFGWSARLSATEVGARMYRAAEGWSH